MGLSLTFFTLVLFFQSDSASVALVAGGSSQQSAKTAPETTVTAQPSQPITTADYRVGADDQLSISILEAPDLSGSVRVSTAGQISLPLLGAIDVSGLTLRQVESTLAERLLKYIKKPHVVVHLTEMRSHAVSVVGAVRRPGVFQVSGAKNLLEVLSLAEGLAEDAGDSVMVMRNSAPDPEKASGGTSQGSNGIAPAPTGAASAAPTIEISLRDLLESGDPQYNVAVYPGDTVKVKHAQLIYVVGEIKKPGGFALRNNQDLTVLQALALSEGVTPLAAQNSTLIIRTDPQGNRKEISIPLDKILKGKKPDIRLQASDILFVPSSTGKSVARGTLDALLRVVNIRPVLLGP